MNHEPIILTAPARIHFGLFAVDKELENQFGGMGLMIEAPRTKLCCCESESLQINGLHRHIVARIVDRWFDAFGGRLAGTKSVTDIPLSIEVLDCPPRHSGLGSGTQLTFSIATAMFHALGLDLPEVRQLATALGRGRRSAIGSHGFFCGGLLVDRGVTQADSIAPLNQRIDFPADWNVVLIQPACQPGLHGRLEKLAFEDLASRSESYRSALVRLCENSIVPAIRRADYDAVGLPLHEFNRKSGEYFADYQFDCYHSQACANIVQDVRAFGIDAVGQSSWGPCIFAIARDDEHANDLVLNLKSSKPDFYRQQQIEFSITKANNTGIQIEFATSSSRSNELTTHPSTASNN